MSRSPVGGPAPVEVARRIRSEEEYRELIGVAVFWLSRWPHGPASQPRLPEDLAKLVEIVDEDAAVAHAKLVALLMEKFPEPPTDGRTSAEANYDPMTAPVPEGDMNGPHGEIPPSSEGGQR